MACLRLMGRKMLVALMMEGKFSGEGLHSMDAEEDLMAALARELVEKAGVGESADAVWQELKRERQIHAAATPAIPAQLEQAVDPEATLLFPGLTGAQPGAGSRILGHNRKEEA